MKSKITEVTHYTTGTGCN